MSFLEAMSMLNEGYKIRKPEWPFDQYIHAQNGKIYFQTGQIFFEPMFQSEYWEVWFQPQM